MKKAVQIFQKFRKTRWFDFACILWYGIIASLAFVPFHLTHLIWLAPFPLFWMEKKYRKSLKKLIIVGFMIGMSATVLSYNWMIHLLQVFGGFPYPIAFFLFLFYALVTNSRYAIYLVIYSRLKMRIKGYGAFIAGFSILCAEFFSYQLFPYYLGNILAWNSVLAQNAEITGVYGLSFLVAVVSYALFRSASGILHGKKILKKKPFQRMLLFPSSVLVLFVLIGTYLYFKWNSYVPEKTKQILMIQPNAPLEFRDGRSVMESLTEIMQNVEDLAVKAADEKKPDIIVMPESGVPFFSTHNTPANVLYNPSYYYRYEALIYLLANRYKTNVYFNEIDAIFLNDKASPKNQRFYNNSVVFSPNGERGEHYRKSYLLAFGEYFPGGEWFPIIYDIIPQVGRFLEGKEQNLVTYYKNTKEPEVLKKSHLKWMDSSYMNMNAIRSYYADYKSETAEEGKFLPLICYEVILPEFVRKFYSAGNPDFIINITNDKWYGLSIETFQHLDLARIRSIEARKWMVRSTNSGTSVFVDHMGRILNENYTAQEASATYAARVPVMREPPTFYVRFGNLFAWLYMVFFSGYWIFRLRGAFFMKKTDGISA
ncbi:MAG TPA: nitrilase-related carbon-nitrogen hydrolase [Leptospiraceae bacterium]|nr:nitrilase-related carbon-nitrogen hydrolase [Leptospiraceae bacterium]